MDLLRRLRLEVGLPRCLAFISRACSVLAELAFTFVVVFLCFFSKLLVLPLQLLLSFLGCPLQLKIAVSQVLMHLFNLLVHVLSIHDRLLVLLPDKVHRSLQVLLALQILLPQSRRLGHLMSLLVLCSLPCLISLRLLLEFLEFHFL